MILIEELKALVPGLTDADLDVIAELERGAVAFVQTQTGKYYGPREDYEDFRRGNGTCYLYLFHEAQDADLADAYLDTDLIVWERPYAGGERTLVTDYDVRLQEGETVLVRHSNRLWTRGYEYVIGYTRGYAEGEEPADIRKVVLSLVRNAWNTADTGGLRSETLGGYSYTFGIEDIHALDDTDQKTLTAKRRQIIA